MKVWVYIKQCSYKEFINKLTIGNIQTTLKTTSQSIPKCQP